MMVETQNTSLTLIAMVTSVRLEVIAYGAVSPPLFFLIIHKKPLEVYIKRTILPRNVRGRFV
jgi:hypothetical protein